MTNVTTYHEKDEDGQQHSYRVVDGGAVEYRFELDVDAETMEYEGDGDVPAAARNALEDFAEELLEPASED